jgi:hypothetical protein
MHTYLVTIKYYIYFFLSNTDKNDNMTHKTAKAQYWRAFSVGHLTAMQSAHTIPKVPTIA